MEEEGAEWQSAPSAPLLLRHIPPSTLCFSWLCHESRAQSSGQGQGQTEHLGKTHSTCRLAKAVAVVELLLWNGKDPQELSHPPPGMNQKKFRWFHWGSPCHRSICSCDAAGGDFDKCCSCTCNSQMDWNLPKLFQNQAAGNCSNINLMADVPFGFKRINN